MCSLTAGLIAASTAMGAYGQYKQASAQADAANAQAAAAEANAKIKNREQEQIADKYGQEDLKRRAQARLAAGRITANAGQAGLSTDTGTSVFDMLSSSEAAYQRDQQLSLSNQRTDNATSRQEQANYEAQAAAYRNQADNIMSNARWGIAGTILSSAAGISGLNTGTSKTTKKVKAPTPYDNNGKTPW